MSDALTRVKAALGKDAVILHTRSVQRGGLLGIGARNEVEITATTDPRVGTVRSNGGERSTSPAPVSPARVPPAPAPPAVHTRDTFNPSPERKRAGTVHAKTQLPLHTTQTPLPIAELHPPSQAVQPPMHSIAPRIDDAALLAEICEIRTMIQQLSERTVQSQTPDVPAELVQHYSRVIGQQVADELARDIFQRVEESMAQSPARARHANPAEWNQCVEAELLHCISGMLPTAEPLSLRTDGQPTVVALVGPTGVGKTTTIAKLAANMKLRENRRVGLITLDSYRIAAVEQLRTYAQILRIPVEAAVTPTELRAALRRLSDVDVVLIDTAGRSQRDEARMSELGELLSAASPDQVHLVLSSTASEQTLREAIERFGRVGARQVVFTKLDEAVGFGVLLNVLHNAGMRMSYFTTGQSVPDDIEVAAAGRVARLIVGGAIADPCDEAPHARSEGLVS